MSKDHSLKVRNLFMEVVDLPESERAAALDHACGNDAALRAEVESLLRAQKAAGGFMAAPTSDAVVPFLSGVDTIAATPHGSGGALHSTTLNERPGTVIGRYKLLQQIGEGGFGVVYMAEQEQPVRRKVALKIIKLGMDTRQVIARFEAERQALAMMDHPHIAKVLDAGATDAGRPYFVMELVKGMPITDYCDKENVPLRDRLALFMNVCAAVQHAHQKGIIHRDIKPNNILVTLHDGKPVPKVIDFGIAKATEQKLTERTMFTEYGQFIGTPEYMSPEQAEMSGLDIDTRSDIYSLGVVLYELLTGATPFDMRTLRDAAIDEIRRIIREDEPSKPSTRISTVRQNLATVAKRRGVEPQKLSTLLRGDLDWIVMKSLEKDRQRRYETPNGLGMDIARYLSGEAVLAAPPSSAYRMRKFVRRNKGVVTAGTLVAASLLLGVIAFAWQATVAREQRDLAITAQKAESEQRKLADDQRDRAVAAEAETKQRAEELQRVSDFQAKMLSQIDVTDAGIKLMGGIRGKFTAALEKNGVPEEDRTARAEAFQRELGNVNATDTAVEMIDQTILQPAIKAIAAEFHDQPAVEASLIETLAEIYRILGRFSDAIQLQTSVLTTYRRDLGDDDPRTIRAVGNMGTMLVAQGKLSEAEIHQRAALDKSRQLFGAEHVHTLAAMSDLGNCLRAQGKFTEAERLLRDALDGMRRTLGNEDRQTMCSMNTLGYLFVDQGLHAEAEKYWREAYETGKRVFGADDRDVFVWTNNLGGLLKARGHTKEAESLFHEALEVSRRTRGEEHPDTLTAISSMADLLKAKGKLAEAEPLYREALEKKRRTLGAEHPDTLLAMSGLGGLLSAQGHLSAAETLYREAAAFYPRAMGAEHPKTILAISNLAVLLAREGKRSEAEPYYREVLEKRRRLLGDDHPDTLVSASNMCALLMEQGKLSEAEPVAREVLEKRQRLLGADHPHTLVSNNIMGQIFARQGKWDEAEPFWREAYDTSRRVLGYEHPDTLLYTNNMGALCKGQGKLTEAESHFRRAYKTSKQALGPEHPTTLLASIDLGDILVMQERFAEAAPLLSRAEPAVRNAFTGTNTILLAILLKNLGKARVALGELAAAEDNLLEAHPIFVTARGNDHKDTRDCTKTLIALYTAWHAAELSKGFDTKAAEWQTKLDIANP